MYINPIKDIKIFDVFKISLPMMISALSSHLMLILDQLVLARFSIDAMTGASAASMWCMVLQFSLASIAIVSGAVVGNYNGARKFELCGMPTWQMVWFSIFTFAISIPLALWCGEYCIPENFRADGLPYFRILMSCSPLSGICYTISTFFVSIGMGVLVTIAVMIANIVNLIVDVALVFGYLGIDCCRGSAGAAVGTVAAWITNITILSFYFLGRKVRVKYGTLNFRLRLDKLKEYLKLGAAAGVGHVIEIMAWCVLYNLLAGTSKGMATIQSIAVSVNFFSTFIVSGLEKGVLAITANLLGMKLKSKVVQVLKNGVYIHLIYMCIISTVFIFAPRLIIDNFVRFDVSPEMIHDIEIILRLVLVYMLFDGIGWVVAGVIEGGGDVNFTMVTIAICVWVVVAIPSIVLYHSGSLSTIKTWLLLDVAVVMISSTLYRRYKSGKWILIDCA
jgi:MATE family multidrug resistance protein